MTMVNKPKAIGTAFESGLVAYLKWQGVDDVERLALAGAEDIGDVRARVELSDGRRQEVIFQCKGGRAAEVAGVRQLRAWLEATRQQAEASARGSERARRELGWRQEKRTLMWAPSAVLVVKRAGIAARAPEGNPARFGQHMAYPVVPTPESWRRRPPPLIGMQLHEYVDLLGDVSWTLDIRKGVTTCPEMT